MLIVVFLRLGNHPEITNSGQSIELPKVPDLYYDGKEIIYLKNYSTVRSLLPGLEYFFRTATEENRRFLESPLCKVSNIEAFSQTYQSLYSYAKKYQQSVGLFSEDGRLSIKNSRDIDQVISLLRSRYYTSDLTG